MSTIHLAIKYVQLISLDYRSSFQLRANHKFIEQNEETIKEELAKSVATFINDNDNPFKIHDYIFKNDQRTPRNIYLLHPLYYLYYTKLTFAISEKLMESKDATTLDFSRTDDKMHIFYRGIFSTDTDEESITTNANTSTSYNNYVHMKQQYIGKPALKLDIQNFYGTVSVDSLISKLRNQLGNVHEVTALEIFLKHCSFYDLPQLHESIASSILSQVYLHDFDEKMTDYLKNKDITYIRFVDDMYFIFEQDKIDTTRKNEIINEVFELLWEDNLSINHHKTRFYNAQQYAKEAKNPFKKEKAKGMDANNNRLNYTVYSNTPTIKRAEEITNTNKSTVQTESNNFTKFIEAIQRLYDVNGLDQPGYRRLLRKYISIQDDDNEGSHSREVFEYIIYNDLWEKLPDDDLEKIVKRHDYLELSPFHLTTLYIKVNRYLKSKNAITYETENTYFWNLYGKLNCGNLNFKRSVMAIAYQLLNEDTLNHDVIEGIKDKRYKDYIDSFCGYSKYYPSRS